MSQFELEDQTLRVSYKKSWEKIIESLELDTLDSNEIPDKMFESDATTACGSICRRDSLHRFLDETERRCCKERECSDKVIKEMRAEAESLREQIFGLEKALNEETEKSKSYFKVIESLEKDNEKWEEDYGELKEKYKLLNERLCRAEKQIEVNRQESIMKMLGRGRKDSGSSGKFEDKLTAKIGLVRTKTRSVLPEDIRKRKSEGANVDDDNDGDNMVEKTTECELVRDFFKGKKTHADELWMNKFKLLKEKLLSEQKKTRNLEFLINTQKEQLETVEKNLSHLKAEKRFVENKLDKMKEEVNLMNEARLREKCKIDNVIAFCDLFQNCVFPQEELIEKLEKVPSVISSFLKGSSSTISFENKENVYPSQLINSVKKHAILKHFNTSSDGTEDQCAKKTAKELQGIRSTLNNIAETLVQATPSADPSVLKNLDNISHIHLTLEECSKTDSHHILNPHLSCNGKKGNNIFKMAIRNTHDTLWNVQSGRKSSTEQSSEGDGSSILPETL